MLIVEAQPFSGSFYFPVTPLIHIIEISGQCFSEYFGCQRIEGNDRNRPETVCYQVEKDGDGKEDAGRSDFDSFLIFSQHHLVDPMFHRCLTNSSLTNNTFYLSRTGQPPTRPFQIIDSAILSNKDLKLIKSSLSDNSKALFAFFLLFSLTLNDFIFPLISSTRSIWPGSS